MSSKLKYIIKYIWIGLVAICLLIYFIYPDLFAKEKIASFVRQFHKYAWMAYFLMHIVRGFLLLPSTPLIFAGVLLFPNNLVWLLIISLIGILASSLLIYFFSNTLGFSKIFERDNTKFNLIENRLLSKNGYLYIILWSFIPIVPTDLICYLSGAIKIKISVFIISILLGELVLCSIYIFGSAFIIN
ncbi:putative membrane protein YdjX (TVP38/TMEM64 family) [Aquimarina sp. MAR_2010_214]|uniref:TVP38/TMEM64 family protein n=1 Tax=Aquimarina sp. MAR_2010_214 TaxID=1250026 RepID=UPI000C70AEAC|nr:VTT domain-containing protein [Aquimarina sp. MAR_2010_214]PKV51259.1 putative membrane protein YdjX (TVP38/TMEM64 family) [Aquimarina sp. MAR_2010_214]